jgi:hypothetical protein
MKRRQAITGGAASLLAASAAGKSLGAAPLAPQDDSVLVRLPAITPEHLSRVTPHAIASAALDLQRRVVQWRDVDPDSPAFASAIFSYRFLPDPDPQLPPCGAAIGLNRWRANKVTGEAFHLTRMLAAMTIARYIKEERPEGFGETPEIRDLLERGVRPWSRVVLDIKRGREASHGIFLPGTPSVVYDSVETHCVEARQFFDRDGDRLVAVRTAFTFEVPFGLGQRDQDRGKEHTASFTLATGLAIHDEREEFNDSVDVAITPDLGLGIEHILEHC